MNVDYAYKYILWQMNKNQAGSVSATEFGYLYNSEQLAFTNDLLGAWQRNNNSKQGNLTGLIENQTILNKLAPCTLEVLLEFVNGYAKAPIDYLYNLGLLRNDYKMFYLTKDQIFNLKNDVIDTPSVATNTYYFTDLFTSVLSASNERHFYSFPEISGTAKLWYIEKPTDVIWNYTITGGKQVYNPIGSVDPIWDDVTAQEICNRCLKKLGVHFKDGDFVNYGNSVIQTAN